MPGPREIASHTDDFRARSAVEGCMPFQRVQSSRYGVGR